MEWTMEKTLQLIEQIAMRPSIWNFTPKDYKNRVVIQKRKDALNEVANYFFTTPKQIEHKLGILRTQYSREKIKMIKSRKSATSEDDIYESKWFAYKPMSFMMMQKRREHIYDDGPDESLTVDYSDNSLNEFKISHVESLGNEEKRLKLDTDEMHDTNSNKKFEEPKYISESDLIELAGSPLIRMSTPHKLRSINNYEKDEFVIFGESIALQLRNLKTKYGKSIAKLNIQKAIFEAEVWEEKNYANVPLHRRSETRSSEDHDNFPDVM